MVGKICRWRWGARLLWSAFSRLSANCYVTLPVTLRYVTIPDPPNLVFLSKSIPFPLQTESALCSSETHEDRRKQVNNHTTWYLSTINSWSHGWNPLLIGRTVNYPYTNCLKNPINKNVLKLRDKHKLKGFNVFRHRNYLQIPCPWYLTYPQT